MSEHSSLPPFAVTRISPGFGFGEGQISGVEADPEILALMDAAINSPEILVPVEAEDDGCSDGREAILTFSKESTFKRSLHRAKVFGGAATMTAAARIGLGLAGGEQLEEVFEHAIDTLTDKGVNFGAHTDEQAHGPNCGCGAIDMAPEILTAVLKEEKRIRGVVEAMVPDSDGLDEVFANFRGYARDSFSQAVPYSGRNVMEGIVGAGKVVKRLGGEHRERRIILNQIPGYTVNQSLIRWVTGDEAQVFAIDTWRLGDIAEAVYPNEPDTQRRAILSNLVYTIATGVVLTKGDLPIDVIKPRTA